MSIRFQCDCGEILVRADESAGLVETCPGCGRTLKIPSGSLAAEEPVLLLGEAESERPPPSPSSEPRGGVLQPDLASPAVARQSSILPWILVPLVVVGLLMAGGIVLTRRIARKLVPSGVRAWIAADTGGLKALGCYTRDSLAGHLGEFKAEAPERAFLVVRLAVPRRCLVPAAAEPGKMIEGQQGADGKAGKLLDGPRRKAKPPARESILVIVPNRFTLILHDGRERPGELVLREADEGGPSAEGRFSNAWVRGTGEPVGLEGDEIIRIAWQLDRKDCAPPLQVRLDNKDPVAVPKT